MFYEIVYCVTKNREVILNNVPDKIDIDIKIAMSNVVAHTFNSFPRNLRSSRQKLLLSAFINAFNALANCFN